jgi:hypothetical protein
MGFGDAGNDGETESGACHGAAISPREAAEDELLLALRYP